MWPFLQNKKHTKKDCEVTVIEETNVIILEGEHYKKFNPEKEELEIIERLIGNNKQLIEIVGRLAVPPKQKPIFTLGTFINNKFYIMADVSLVLGTPKTGVFTLLDNKTGSPIAASFSNQSVGTNSNPEFASFSLDPANPNQVIGSGVAAGSGTVVISTHADYSDPGDGTAQSADFSVTKNYSVIASADGASFDVVFP